MLLKALDERPARLAVQHHRAEAYNAAVGIDAMLLLAASIMATPKVWLPTERTLDTRLLTAGSPFYELLNLDYQQDPVAFGLEFATAQDIVSVSFGFSSLGGRVYEPSPSASFLEVRSAGKWRVVHAQRRRDYSHIGDFAPMQMRGTTYWSYRFPTIEADAVRLRADAPAYTDPGYRCIVLASVLLSDEAFDGDDVVVGSRPNDTAEWLRPGANLLAAETGATASFRNSLTTVRWPRPVMLNAIRGKNLRQIEFLAGREWRPMGSVPVATVGLRAHGSMESVSLDSEGTKYFDQLRVGRSDLLGMRFRSSKQPDLEEMQSYLLPIDFSMGAIGRPADFHETMTLWSGMFLMMDGGAGTYPRDGSTAPAQALDRWFLPMSDGKDWGQDWLRTHSKTADGGLPATVTHHAKDGIEFEQTLFVTSPDDPFYTNIAIVKITNRSRRSRKTTFGYATGLRPIWQPVWTPFLQDPWPTHYHLDPDRTTVRNAKGEVVLHSSEPLVWGGTGRENHVSIDLDLKPNESRTLAFAFPNVDAPVKGVPDYDAFRSYDRFEAWWNQTLGTATIHVPEEPLNDIVRNLIAQSMIVALDGDQVRYGAYFYEMYFGIEEGWPAVALAQFGQPNEAKRIAETMLSDEHMDKTNYHHQYRNGLAPWYAITVARLLGDDAWLRSLWPRIKAAAEWTIKATETNQDKEYGGILPRHIYGGDIGNPAYSFYSNATCWRGLQDTADTASKLGFTEDARRYQEKANRYRKRLMELADKLVDRSGGLPFLPMAFEIGSGDGYRKAEPAYPFLAAHVLSSDLWNYLGNYWNLFAPMLLEVRLFPQGDSRERWIPDYIEQRGGILNGLVRFDLGYDSVYGKGYIESLLEQGRRDEFQTALYGLLGNSLSRNFYVMPEVSKVFDLRTDNASLYREYQRMRWNYFYRFVGPWMEGWQGQEGDPLAAGAGMTLQALRMALVREDFAEDPPKGLRLLDGVPAKWFEPGKRISFHRINSFFGPISLDCQASKAGYEVEIEAQQGVPMALRLRGPLKEVIVDGTDVPPREKETIQLVGTGKTIKLSVTLGR